MNLRRQSLSTFRVMVNGICQECGGTVLNLREGIFLNTVLAMKSWNRWA